MLSRSAARASGHRRVPPNTSARWSFSAAAAAAGPAPVSPEPADAAGRSWRRRPARRWSCSVAGCGPIGASLGARGRRQRATAGRRGPWPRAAADDLAEAVGLHRRRAGRRAARRAGRRGVRLARPSASPGRRAAGRQGDEVLLAVEVRLRRPSRGLRAVDEGVDAACPAVTAPMTRSTNMSAPPTMSMLALSSAGADRLGLRLADLLAGRRRRRGGPSSWRRACARTARTPGRRPRAPPSPPPSRRGRRPRPSSSRCLGSAAPSA